MEKSYSEDSIDEEDDFKLAYDDYQETLFKTKVFKAIYTINQSFTLPIIFENILIYVQYIQFMVMAPATIEEGSYLDRSWLSKWVSSIASFFVDPLNLLKSYNAVYLYILSVVFVIMTIHLFIIAMIIYNKYFISNCYILTFAYVFSYLLGSIFMIPFISNLPCYLGVLMSAFDNSNFPNSDPWCSAQITFAVLSSIFLVIFIIMSFLCIFISWNYSSHLSFLLFIAIWPFFANLA